MKFKFRFYLITVDFYCMKVGAVERERMLPRTGDIIEDDVLISLPSSGVHSNGFRYNLWVCTMSAYYNVNFAHIWQYWMGTEWVILVRFSILTQDADATLQKGQVVI